LNVAVLGIKAIPAVAGADRVVEQLLENFSPSNDYWVYLRADSPRVPPAKRNVHFVLLPALKGKHVGAFSFFFICSLHYLWQRHYDVAHVHNSDFGLFTLLLQLKRNVPVLGTFHGDPYTRQKWGLGARLFLRFSERCFVQFCDRLTSVSKFKAHGRGFGPRESSIDYVPNGINDASVSEAFADPLLAAQRLHPRSYVLFACGRLDPTKGLHHLLDAYERANPQERLLIIGDFTHDREYSANVERRIAEISGTTSRVCVVRTLLPRERLLRVLGSARLFVFPSEYEAMSMMLLEAVSSRTPVLCSDIPENLAVVGEHYPYTHRTRDVAALTQKLREALREPAWQPLTEELYARCMREFSWPVIARRYEHIYDELAAAR
jgi:glycosyltransferase involved in cell wall biosynthesis